MGAPWRGLQLVAANQSLWGLVIAPFCITLCVLLLAMWTAFTQADTVLLWIFPGLANWPALLLFAWAAMVLVLLVVLGVAGTMLAALLCLPIHDALSQRVEGLKGAETTPESFMEALPRSIAHSILGLTLWVTLQLVISPVQLLPAIGTLLELVLGLGLTAFFLAHQLTDGPMSRRRMGFGEKMTWLWENLATVLGLGAVGTILVAIPVVNAVGLPVTIVGGTLLFLELGGHAGNQ